MKRAHKSEGNKPYPIGQSVIITEYVFSGKSGVIMERFDTDDPESYNCYVYGVSIEGSAKLQYLTEFEVAV